MRVAALYDIHGNLPALEAVLAEVEAAAPDLVVVGGDVVAGPLPGATLGPARRPRRPGPLGDGQRRPHGHRGLRPRRPPGRPRRRDRPPRRDPARLPERALTRAVNEAQVQRLVTPAEPATILTRYPGRRTSPRTPHQGATRFHLEDRSIRFLTRHDLPLPDRNTREASRLRRILKL